MQTDRLALLAPDVFHRAVVFRFERKIKRFVSKFVVLQIRHRIA
jgi:hypothetical protein